MPITSSSRPVSSARDCCSTSPSHIPGSSGPPSDPGCAPSDPESRPPNSSSQPRYASGFLNFYWIPRNTTSSRNSSPNERIPIKCRASNSQLERKFWANPRLSSTSYHQYNRLGVICDTRLSIRMIQPVGAELEAERAGKCRHLWRNDG